MPLRPLIALLALTLPLAALAQDYTPLARRMSPQAFRAAGLDRLTPAQLAALDDWLRTHPQGAAKVVDESGAPVFYTSKSRREPIEAHIAGAFEGWGARGEVALDNGQRWRKTSGEQPSCSPRTDPAVRINPSLFGNWLMYVDGCSDSVHVKRVK